MTQQVVLITGANGEIGHSLIHELAALGSNTILTLDLQRLDPSLRGLVAADFPGDILDTHLLERISSRYEITLIFHLAALLSTRAEFSPEIAHKVNVDGTMNLLRIATQQSRQQGETVRFIFPSSIAIYGLPDLAAKESAPPVEEDHFNQPTTMYGCTKLYCEHLGRYYANFYRRLDAAQDPFGIDFRCLRFPGLISAVTLPSGGTSDYGPEMLHAAAQQQPYRCFVRPETRIPFMAMPDAIRALLRLADAPRERLARQIYNVTAFSPSAEEIAGRVRRAFPNAHIEYDSVSRRQSIVDSWPADLDDSAARRDWDWAPQYDFDSAFDAYLIPAIRQRYGLA